MPTCVGQPQCFGILWVAARNRDRAPVDPSQTALRQQGVAAAGTEAGDRDVQGCYCETEPVLCVVVIRDVTLTDVRDCHRYPRRVRHSLLTLKFTRKSSTG